MSTDDFFSTAKNDTHADDLYNPPESAEAVSIRPVLMVFDQNKLHEWFMIVQKETTIGRDQQCDIHVPDDTVSRRHAAIVFENIDRPGEEPICVLQDGGSRNGSYLNGDRVEKSIALKNGDRVFVGNTCIAYFLRTELEINSDQKLRSMATTDNLTGLMNRGYMAIQFQREFYRSKRYARPLSMIMLDIDDFKKVNDCYGHMIGDKVLEVVARLIAPVIRVHDLAARYGGEEFAILLPETTLQGCLVIAERIRKSIANYQLPVEDKMISVTASLGVAEIDHTNDRSVEEILENADQALLKAKRCGKNQVCVFDRESSGILFEDAFMPSSSEGS